MREFKSKMIDIKMDINTGNKEIDGLLESYVEGYLNLLQAIVYRDILHKGENRLIEHKKDMIGLAMKLVERK